MPRSFNGSSWIDFPVGAIGTAAFIGGTLAVILRYTGASGVARVLMAAGSSTGGERVNMQILATNQVTVRWGTAAPVAATITAPPGEGWILLAATNPGGVIQPRFHKYVFTTGVWTHELATANAINPTGNPASLTLAAFTGGASPFIGDLAAAAFWRGVALTDQAVEALASSLQAWFQRQPTAMWLLDQDDVTQKVPDLSGNGSTETTGRVGTTVGTVSAPFGYGQDLVAG